MLRGASSKGLSIEQDDVQEFGSVVANKQYEVLVKMPHINSAGQPQSIATLLSLSPPLCMSRKCLRNNHVGPSAI